MKRNHGYGILLIIPVLLISLMLAGCGVSQADYDAALANAAGLAADKADLEGQVASLSAGQAALEAEKASLQSQVDSLTANKAALQADKANLEADKTALQADKTKLTGDLADLQETYNAVSADLTALEAVYPPRSFASRNQLQSWLNTNTVSEQPVTVFAEDWYAKAIELQRDAVADGYVISVDYDTYDDGSYGIFCTTVINGIIYYWDPETDEIFEETGLVGIENPTV